MTQLQDIDLNLLLVFQLMYRERKTGVVAEQLGLSQPAVSNALARLRKALNDELFERTSRGMKPTPYADLIAEPIAYALATLQDTINYHERFDPLSSERAFRIAMTDLGEMYLLPKLMAHLARVAPGISITTVRNSGDSLKEEMEAGSVDLAIGLLPQLEAGFYQRRLFEQQYVCLMRKEHPLAGGPLDLEAFSQARHIVIEAQGTGHGRVEKLLAQSGVSRIVKLRLPHFMSAPYIVRETDLIATVTEKLALQTMDTLGLVAHHHPVALPSVQINLFWHRRYHQDTGSIWLRSQIFNLFAE
ncbi:LysR family transcriptional regulator [Zobellella endophytica]|uniref:LysR family transcriptional regulator n=1 Tax=Zobellella endophytica TaxID=2116700 RepID=A0A2P7R3C7_9GAMM|nr:LysR family transcriptional regulator [Zobellella endophytica]PSJ44719.1 LysR family transcriptional regulator [Zobellella endophytica]